MFVIGVDELSLSDMRNFRLAAKEMAIAEALKLAMAANSKELVNRNIFPHTDLPNGYTNEVFITGAVAVNTWTSVYDTAVVPQLGTRKVLVIYKVVNMTAVPSITAVRFRLGATGVTTLGWAHLEQVIDVKMTPECYLSEPIVYTKDQFVDIQCYARIAIPAAGERLGFEGFVVEPLGEAIS